MMPNPCEEGLRWLRQARQDMDDARYARQGDRFNLACFMAQQAAEKAIKGFLYAQGRTLVLGHSVARLCQEASDFLVEFEDLRRRAAPLDKDLGFNNLPISRLNQASISPAFEEFIRFSILSTTFQPATPTGCPVVFRLRPLTRQMLTAPWSWLST